MAVSDAYATPQLYRALIDKTDTADDSVIQSDLNAVSRYVERKLGGRCFNQEGTTESPVARIYAPRLDRARNRRISPLPVDGWAESENPWMYGGAMRVLKVDDLVSVSAIAIDQSNANTFDLSLTSTDYELTPRNAALGPEPEPYTVISLTEWGKQWAFPPMSRVRVTGVWGWPAVPEAIVRAVVQLTAILRLESPRGSSVVTDIGGGVLGISKAATSIIEELTLHYGKVGF